MAKKWTFVALVLDRSGSMATIKHQALTGFNEQLDVIKENAKKGGRTRVMLTVFNEEITEVFSGRTAGKVEKLTEETYRPGGLTAMYDAVGHVIYKLDTEAPMGEDVGPDDNVAFLVVIVSDGYENASRLWTSHKLAEKVDELQKRGNWTFAYIGSNQDLSQIQRHLKFANVGSWTSDVAGTMALNSNLRSSTTSYFDSRSQGIKAVDDYYKVEDDEDSAT